MDSLNSKNNDLTELQIVLLEMLKWFHLFCEKNNLRYYIVEGTVIGAVRHHGFIPWDDDIDVGMPRSDYNRLMQYSDKIDGRYVLETPYSENKDYRYPWCKLFDLTTTKIEKMRNNYRLGVYIDIFPLDGLGDTLEESKKNYRKIDFLNILWATRVCALNKKRGLKKNMAIILSRCIPQAILDDKWLIKKIDKECGKRDFDNQKYVSCTLSTYRKKEIMKRSIYGTPTKYDFNGTIVYGPEKYDDYLKIIYGDWWVFPPKEKQINQHDYIYLNLHEPYQNIRESKK